MNKKIVAFALSTTALLGAGAVAPVAGVETAFAYESTAEVAETGTLGTASYTLYEDDTLVVSNGAFTASELRSLVRSYWSFDIVFENAEVDGSAEGLMEGTDVSSVSGELKVVGSMASAFGGCESLGEFSLKLAEGSRVTDVSDLFAATQLESVDLTGWDASAITNAEAMFYGCSDLTTVNLTGWQTTSLTSMKSMFSSCNSLTTVIMPDWDTSNVTDMQSAFMGCGRLASLDVSGWDTSKVTTTENMFSSCGSLKTLDVSNWNTGSVTNMGFMFAGCDDLATLDVSGWDVSKVTNLTATFQSCESLGTLAVSDWNTASATSMNSMFEGCDSLTSLDLSGWDTKNVTTTSTMFAWCESLESLDLSGWNLPALVYAGGMFESDPALTTLSLSGWSVPALNQTTFAFYECRNLATLDVSGFTYGAENSSAVKMFFSELSSVNKLVLDNPDGIDFLELLPVDDEWVMRLKPAVGRFSTAGLIDGWDNATMAGTWYTASTVAPIERLSVYRLYNPNSGEHFYTLSEVERDATVAAGWTYEGIGWTAPDESLSPVYRLYSGTDHFYTMDEEEKDSLVEEGWIYEGIAFYSADAETGIALLRQFNPFVDPEAATNNAGSHNYTTDQVENDYLVSIGWVAEDVAWYGMAPEADEGEVPVEPELPAEPETQE
jgi:surface protein